MTIAKKFMLMVAGAIGVLSICIAVILRLYLSDSISEEAARSQVAAVDNVKENFSIVGTLMEQHVRSSLKLLMRTGIETGQPRIAGTAAVAGIQVPNLYCGGASQTNVHSLVDRVTSIDPGMTATLFVRQGTDYYRVSTNVKKNDGSRAIGTTLDPSGRAYAAIQRGEPYYGVVDILGKRYFAGYEPMTDAAGRVIGIWYVGYPVTVVSQLEKLIKSIAILDNGFVFVTDKKKGTVLFSGEKSGTQWASSILEQVNASNVKYYKVEKADFSSWGCDIYAVYPLADLDSRISTATWMIVLGSALLIGILCIVLFGIIRRVVARPLALLTQVAHQLSLGDIGKSEGVLRSLS